METDGQQPQSEWAVDSASIFEIRTVGSPDDIEKSKAYTPTFTHQVVGPREIVVGYKHPRVKIYISPGHQTTHVSLLYDELCQDAECDDVVKMVTNWLPQGSTRSLDEFCSKLSEEENFHPYGTLMHSYVDAEGTTFEVYHGDTSMDDFVEYHKRTEMWLIWFIESASTLDLDDDRWELLHLFEKRESGGITRYHLAGILSICTFHCYPYKVRPRISQMCLLPQYRGRGHGEHLLNQAYQFCMTKYKTNYKPSQLQNRVRNWTLDDIAMNNLPASTLVDITVEEPSSEFSKLRDKVDCKNMLSVFPNQPFYEQTFSSAAPAIHDRLHLYEPQARRVFEILQLKHIGGNHEKLNQYRNSVKKRLYQSLEAFQRINCKSFRRFNDDSEADVANDSTVVLCRTPSQLSLFVVICRGRQY